MNITINVDETQFKDLLEKELKEMPKEELHELIKMAFTQYITQDPNALKDLFVKKDNSYYSNGVVPTDFTRKIINDIDFSSIAAEIAKPVEDLFKNNIREIVEQLVAQSISHAIYACIAKSGDLETAFNVFYINQKMIERDQNR